MAVVTAYPPTLDRAMIEFAGRMTTAVVTTADDSGECECALRSGPPGFVRVLNERTIAYPEHRAATGQRWQVELLMVDVAADRVGLRVTGTASLIEDSVLRGEHPDLAAATADRWMLVHVVTAVFGAPA